MSRPATPFWDYVDKTGSCWVWNGARNLKGYGSLGVGGRIVSAHRRSWEMANGEIPSGLHVLHKCDNPACVNPDHLFLGSNLDNMLDKTAKGRQQTKLTVEQVKVIKRNIGKISQTKLAEWFGVHQSSISHIKTGRHWADVEV